MTDMYVGVVHGFFSVELQPGEYELWKPDIDFTRAATWKDKMGDELWPAHPGSGSGASALSDRV